MTSTASKLSSVRLPVPPAEMIRQIRAERARRASEAERQRIAIDAERKARCQTLDGFIEEFWTVLEPKRELKGLEKAAHVALDENYAAIAAGQAAKTEGQKYRAMGRSEAAIRIGDRIRSLASPAPKGEDQGASTTSAAITACRQKLVAVSNTPVPARGS